MRAPRAFKEIHSLTFERRETKKWLFRLPSLQCVGAKQPLSLSQLC